MRACVCGVKGVGGEGGQEAFGLTTKDSPF